MTPLELALAAVGLLLISALVVIARPRTGTIASWAAVLACAVGLWAAVEGLVQRGSELVTAWQVPGGELVVGIDPLSAFFLVPLFAIGALVTIYGRAYLAHGAGRSPAVSAALLNVMLATMALVLLARHAMVFLLAWEGMTLAAYLLVTTEHRDAEVRRAGWVYLIASHVGVIALLAMFVVVGDRTGTLELAGFGALAGASRPFLAVVFGLALVGFGVKAGVLGLHVWLPEAHAAAPSHVSALMSAVMIKLGLYGLVRIVWAVPPSESFGVVLMILGALGALFAIAVALYQRDLKRCLAYSSVENMGIMLLGIGLATWAHARGNTPLAVLGFAGGLLHVWNHAAMKALMFLCAGNVLHATGTRDLERLGGLLRRMRVTGSCMVVGAVAIAALPPLNAFVSEWLIYRGLTTTALGTGAASLAAMAGVALLALVGGLAALCFVRLIGIALLGEPRSEAARAAHDGSRALTLPVVILASVCVAGALFPQAALLALTPLVRTLAGSGEVTAASARDTVMPVAIANAALLWLVVVIGALVVARTQRAAADATWGCGYLDPGPRMQYTGRAFAELLTARVIPRPIREKSRISPPEGLFPSKGSLATDCTDPVTRVYEPFLVRWGDRFARLRWLQQGNLHAYLLYIVAVAVLGIAWANLRDWWSP